MGIKTESVLPPGRGRKRPQHIVRSEKICQRALFVSEGDVYESEKHSLFPHRHRAVDDVRHADPASFLLSDQQSWLSLAASLIGVTSLIFNARGYAFGQLLIIVFSLIYGVLSYRQAYYGEMITYLGMTMPMAAAALISWIRHPSSPDSASVQVSRMSSADIV